MHPFTHISHYRHRTPRGNPPHRHPNWEWVVVLSGRGTTRVSGEDRPLGPGTAALYPPGLDHSEAFGPHFETHVIGMRHFGRVRGFHLLEEPILAPSMASLIWDLYSRKPRFWLEDCQRLSGVLGDLFQQRIARGPEDVWVVRTEELLLSHLGDASFRLEPALRDLGLSESRLHHRFKAARGLSPRQYLIQARIDEGARMLAQTDWKIEEIATHTGFFDRFHFSRAFKARTSETPASYRRRHREP